MVNSQDNYKKEIPKIPTMLGSSEFELKNHQKIALKNWGKNNARGILALATGAGKTVTAIYGAVELSKKIRPLMIIIGVPYQNLADQWCDVLALFNIYPTRAYKNKKEWLQEIQQLIANLNLGTIDLGVCVVVNNTLKSVEFQSILSMISSSTQLFFIGDECHYYGSKKLNISLPQNARLRLGLSATPFHYVNDSANERLKKYFGNIVYEYSLQDALDDNVLSQYEYHVIPVELTNDESFLYAELSHQIAIQFHSLKNEEDEHLENLLRKRSRLIGSAANKLGECKRLLQKLDPAPFSLFYCGDGRIESSDFDTDSEIDLDTLRQVEAVTALLAQEGWCPSRFTSNETSVERQMILDDFRNGDIKSLVAIKCLDEGIDIPACQRAFFLSSSSNPRQFIQRRGRILRKSENKEKSIIYDFFVFAPTSSTHSDYDTHLIKRELGRVVEFSRSALNSVDSYSTLRPILENYDLTGYF